MRGLFLFAWTVNSVHNSPVIFFYLERFEKEVTDMRQSLCLVGLILTLTGCSLNLPGDGIICTEVFIFGITVFVTDENGTPISDATVIITEGQFNETLTEVQDGFYPGAEERQGTYTLTIQATGFEPVIIENIVVTGDECHVTPVGRDITLQPAQ